MEIKISRAFSKGNFLENNSSNAYNDVLALIINKNKQTLLVFSEKEMKEINKFLLIKGWAGHIPFHDWLKENKPKYFHEYITDSDKEGIVLPLLIKLKEFLKITD